MQCSQGEVCLELALKSLSHKGLSPNGTEMILQHQTSFGIRSLVGSTSSNKTYSGVVALMVVCVVVGASISDNIL